MDQFNIGSDFKTQVLPINYGVKLTDNITKNELLITLNVNNVEHIFRFKNAVRDIESGMIKFVFTFNCESTVLCIEYENLTHFLIHLIDDKYNVDKNETGEVFNNLIENLDFYLLGYNPLIKKFTFSNILNLINKIGYVIINTSRKELIKFDKNKMKIQKRLYQLNNDTLEDDYKNKKNPSLVDYNNNVETWENIFKKIWLLFNHLEKYDKTLIEYDVKYENYYTLLDFIFDQNK